MLGFIKGFRRTNEVEILKWRDLATVQLRDGTMRTISKEIVKPLADNHRVFTSGTDVYIVDESIRLDGYFKNQLIVNPITRQLFIRADLDGYFKYRYPTTTWLLVVQQIS